MDAAATGNGMADQSIDKKVLGDKALELVMRDVLCGMEDLATRLGYDVTPYRVEILSVEPAAPAARAEHPVTTAVVIEFPQSPATSRPHALRKKIS
jgi:hypothetical protein